MGGHGQSRYFHLFPDFIEKWHAKTRQVPPNHGQSRRVREIPRTKGGLHSYEQFCKNSNLINLILLIFLPSNDFLVHFLINKLTDIITDIFKVKI
jgi:hypothetical protein